jgi:uncharacterized protein
MTTFVPPDDPVVARLVAAVQTGDHDALRSALAERPDLATEYLGDAAMARTALHVATDWPGHFPGIDTTIEILVAAGADVDAPFVGSHSERPLHWAASSGDLIALDALIAAGADPDAPGGVLTSGGPLDDAVIFDMLDCARRLVDAGAAVELFHAAALGLDDRVADLAPAADQQHRDSALWHACHQGRTGAAAILLAAGADPTFEGFGEETTRQAAQASADPALAALVEAAATRPR